MSVFVILRIPGDPGKFERYAKENADLMRRISGDGKAAGAIHHAFGGGDGEFLVIDEWPDAESFQRFFDTQTEIPRLMQEAGATGAPQVSIYPKLDTPDVF
jgi:hypothetical protein